MFENFDIELANEIDCPYCGFHVPAHRLEIEINSRKTNYRACPGCNQDFALWVTTKLLLSTVGLRPLLILAVDFKAGQKKKSSEERPNEESFFVSS